MLSFTNEEEEEEEKKTEAGKMMEEQDGIMTDWVASGSIKAGGNNKTSERGMWR